jgi:GNAT superfamily N-acetyltransferase
MEGPPRRRQKTRRYTKPEKGKAESESESESELETEETQQAFEYEVTDEDIGEAVTTKSDFVRQIIVIKDNDLTFESEWKPVNSKELLPGYSRLVIPASTFVSRDLKKYTNQFWVKDGNELVFFVSIVAISNGMFVLDDFAISKKFDIPEHRIRTYWSRVENEIILHNAFNGYGAFVALIQRPLLLYFSELDFEVESIASNGAFFVRKRILQIDEFVNYAPTKTMEEITEENAGKTERRNKAKKEELETAMNTRLKRELKDFTEQSAEWASSLVPTRRTEHVFFGKPPNMSFEEFRQQLEDICGNLVEERDEVRGEKFKKMVSKLKKHERKVICFLTPRASGTGEDRIEAFLIYKLRYHRGDRSSSLYIEFVCTRPSAQKEGYGRRLIEAAEKIVMHYKESAQVAFMYLQAVSNAISYYSRLGFIFLRYVDMKERRYGAYMRTDNLYRTMLQWKPKIQEEEGEKIQTLDAAAWNHSDRRYCRNRRRCE